ncbi:DUF7065 domain-containing protein [Gordonia sp. KTR9]|uniref:DUF7065 domain-containing protein n=1 Tax=Gordonia sp. KTR9 TaxID=337191 RepID=UPI00027DDC18|nr:hypothetical protein [Gordonia sp. KTR9]AFR48203.1 hypotheticcal protein [Gordonia sp. KTR9]
MLTTENNSWGPLSEGVHRDVVDERPWRDNAYLCFWDIENDLYGALHVSTSPNAGGRRARLTVHVGNEIAEVVEDLEPGTVSSESISFDFGDRFSVDAENLSGELIWEPHFALANYTDDRTPAGFEFDSSAPLQHYQRAAQVSGSLTINGVDYSVRGEGVRDRTWGFRDESINLRETIGFFWVFPDYAISAFRILLNNGTEAVQGYVLRQESAEPITGFSITRDAMGLFVGTTLKTSNGDEISVRAERRGGHFSPMGFERTGPTHSAYDEFSVLDRKDGVRGFGMIEQGVVRQMH